MLRLAHSRRTLAIERLEARSLLATLPTGFVEAPLATGLSNATAMEVAPNGDLWVLEQAGTVKRFRPGSTTADVVGNLSTLGMSSTGERGLLGIAFDPGYAANKQVFLYYTATNPNTHNRISRFTVEDTDAADYYFAGTSTTPEDAGSSGTPTQSIIFELDALSNQTNHNGGAIHFGPDGKLYAAVGENANRDNAQTLANLHGKMLRINSDGTIPDDNPFYDIATDDERAIWALGLRNPFTFAFQPGTGRMFINDVGENTWEEINEGVAGANYGWPGVEGNNGTPPSGPGTYVGPLYTYSHGTGTFQGFVITGGAFYNPATPQFPTEFTGDYFFADFSRNWINVINLSDNSVTRFASSANGVVDLRVTNDGSLLYLSRGGGTVMRVQYPDGIPPDTLRVTELTPTDTGFIAQLSRPLTMSDLNLYDQGSLFGAADATLVGNSVGNVRGSLVVNQAGDQVTFVATGGTLANDTYTVTLRSAANAFHDGADLLDGNADGTAGDDYINSFTRNVAGTPIIAAIPDFARGFSQSVNLWNAAAQSAYDGIPVLLSTGAGVRSVSFTINYDPALLSIDTVALGAAVADGSALTFSIPTPGTIDVAVINDAADLGGDGFALVHLKRGAGAPLVPASAPYGAQHVLDITGLAAAGPGGAPLTSVADDGLHVAAYPGDLNGNQAYNAPDTSFVQQLILNPATFGLAAYPLADPRILADINANGQVQANDVSQVQRLILNLPSPFVPPLPAQDAAPPGEFAISGPTESPTTDTTVTFAWTQSADADHYRLSFNDNETCTAPQGVVENIMGTSHTLTVAFTKVYHVCVTAFDEAGNERAASNSGSFTFEIIAPPGEYHIGFVTRDDFIVDAGDTYPPFPPYIQHVKSGDYYCTRAAIIAGIIPGPLDVENPQVRAYLSTQTRSALEHWDIDNEIRDTRGNIIVPGSASILNNDWITPFKYDEFGNELAANSMVWTGTNGLALPTDNTCVAWNSYEAFGTFGRTHQTTNAWTDAGTSQCGETVAHLYCLTRLFQDPN